MLASIRSPGSLSAVYLEIIFRYCFVVNYPGCQLLGSIVEISVAVVMDYYHHDYRSIKTLFSETSFNPGYMCPELCLCRNIKAVIMSSFDLEDHNGLFKVGDYH
jgi:hypothetical protein